MASEWKTARFEDVFDFKGGSQPPKSEFINQPKQGYIRLLQIRDFEDDSKAVYIKDQKKWPKCTDNDIMIGRYGASVGRVLGGKAGAYNVALVRLIFDPSQVHRGWARHFCRSSYFQEPLKNISRSAQNGFNKEDLAGIEFPFPSFDEQRAIAEKVDSLSQLSEGARDDLARIPRLIERFKQAILTAAFRGDLTAAWRSTVQSKQKKTLLDEVAAIRAAHFKRLGMQGKPAVAPSWTPSIAMPPGWEWVSIDQLATLVQYGSSAKTSDLPAVPVLRMGNIVDGKLDCSSLKYLPRNHEEFPELLLADGDILFNRTNSAELVGKTAVYRDLGCPTSFASYLIRVRVVGYLPDLLSAYINSEYGRAWVASVVSQQVGQANVNGTKLRELGVPLMPLDEQKQIWSQIEQCFAHIDHIAREVSRATDHLDRLEQATLAKAFRGELLAV